jgi:hypothetical protein
MPICQPIEPEDNFGIGVSTIWADDIGCYETALIDSKGAYPVQRYSSRESAILGHWEWITISRTIESVIQIGHEAYNAPDTVIHLSRKTTLQ